jgi:outer membrane autotransporter protein
VSGGWQADLTGVGSSPFGLPGLPAAGVILGSSVGTATLTNDGSIGALSDRAVASTPLFPSNNTSIINNGTITGFVQLVGSDNSFLNNGMFNLRHFADTTGAPGGVRDTLRVAVSNLGAGTFTNNGTLALLGGPGATTLDATGQYLPLGQTSNAMALGGPVQGQLLGATTFTNSGIINLQANPVPGDVLLITGGHTPGTNGGGTFISNGGQLLLDTVLNEGGVATRSDTLVVDGTQLGPNGATSISIKNAGGAGALTPTNGILVVQVLDPARSAPGVFTLGNPELRAGDFDYRLFQGGINGSAPGDWFLRNSFIVPPVTPPPGPVEPIGPDPPPAKLPPGVWPIIGPELATDGVVQPIARQMGLQTLGTLHQRIGDTLTIANTGGQGAGVARSDWARFFGEGFNKSFDAFADPRASGWMGGFQGGVDLLRTDFWPGHRDVAGVYLAFANSDVSVNGLVTNAAATGYVQTKTGTLGLNGYSAGGYWTHYGPGGWYIDAVLQGTYYTGNAITQFANLPINGSGFISSLEGGYPIPLPLGPRFVLEPQAQIIWQQVAFAQANDGLGPVGLGTTSGPTGRVGLRGMWTIDGYNGQVWQPYGRVNLWRDWGAEATTMFGIDPVPLIEEATRLEFAGGVTALLGRGVSLYAQAGYQFGLDGAFLRNAVQGDVGLRYVW